MNQKISLGIVVAVLLLAVAGAAWLYFNNKAKNKPEPLASTLANQNPVKEFTVNGEVVKVENDRLIVKMAKVVAAANGNQVSYEERTVKVAKDTIIIKAVKEGGVGFTKTPIKLADIPVSGMVTVHLTENPFSKTEVTARQIDYLPK